MPDKSKIEWTDATWRAVPTHPGYFVTADGRLRGPSGRELRPMATKDGHLYVLTPLPRRPRKLFVHRAVLSAFDRLPNDGEEGRHLDGCPANNRIGNLAWGTKVEQREDDRRNGTHLLGERKGTAKLSEAEVIEIRALYGTVSLRDLARRFGVSHTAVRRAALGIKWGHIAEGLRHAR